MTEEGPAGRCGPLDLRDRRGYIPTGPVSAERVAAALEAATASPAFDGAPVTADEPTRWTWDTGTVIFGERTVAKAQHREHELLASARWFERIRRVAGLPAPPLRDAGVVNTPGGPIWWLVLGRVPGRPAVRVSRAQQRTLGGLLRRWHTLAPPNGLRLDDPGGLGVFLGTPRDAAPRAAATMADAIATVCPGLPMTAVHGDVGVALNTLSRGGGRLALLDPGAVHVAPPMLDLAWALAVDLPLGGSIDALLDGYGREAVADDVLDALLAVALARRLVDRLLAGDHRQSGWLRDELNRRAPTLLRATRLGSD